MEFSLKRWVHPFIGLSVTVAFLWLVRQQISFREVGETVARVPLSSLLFALGFLTIDYIIKTIRWWWMLRVFDPELPARACGWPFIVSISLNNLLPFRIGDAVRVFGFNKLLRLPSMQLLGTLIIERLLDFVTLLGFFFLGLQGLAVNLIPAVTVRLAWGIAVAGTAGVMAFLLFSKRMQKLIQWMAEYRWLARMGWTDRIRRHSEHFFEAVGLLCSPVLMLQLVFLSILVWGFEGALFATIAGSLSVPNPMGAWFALATGTLATLLPSSPGYVWTFDYFTMLGIMAYGAAPDVAAAFAFIVHLVLWLPLTLAGMTYFLRPGARVLLRYAEILAVNPKGSQ